MKETRGCCTTGGISVIRKVDQGAMNRRHQFEEVLDCRMAGIPPSFTQGLELDN